MSFSGESPFTRDDLYTFALEIYNIMQEPATIAALGLPPALQHPQLHVCLSHLTLSFSKQTGTITNEPHTYCFEETKDCLLKVPWTQHQMDSSQFFMKWRIQHEFCHGLRFLIVMYHAADPQNLIGYLSTTPPSVQDATKFGLSQPDCGYWVEHAKVGGAVVQLKGQKADLLPDGKYQTSAMDMIMVVSGTVAVLMVWRGDVKTPYAVMNGKLLSSTDLNPTFTDTQVRFKGEMRNKRRNAK